MTEEETAKELTKLLKKPLLEFMEQSIDTRIYETLLKLIKNIKKNNKEDIINTHEKKIPRFIPVSKWNKYHDWPASGGLRHLIFFKDTNGFAKCVKKVGKSVLIDENAFLEWINNNGK